jgi:hypothetical protein
MIDTTDASDEVEAYEVGEFHEGRWYRIDTGTTDAPKG